LRPFFSIAITTYDRQALLKEALVSVSNQTFADFEVLIGNDLPEEPLSTKVLGVDDPRVRIINNPRNLGEVGNLNALLEISCGKYFALVADDDLLSPNYLQAAYEALIRFDFPKVVYTTFVNGSTIPPEASSFEGRIRVLSGREFLKSYLAHELKAIGTMGVFNREYLRKLDGFENVSGGRMALHTEYLQIVKTGLLEKVAYVDAPLVVYRVHEGSWGCTNREMDYYRRSEENLIRRSIVYLLEPELIQDFGRNLTQLLKLVLAEFSTVLRGQQVFHLHQFIGHLFYARRYVSSLKGSQSYWRAIWCLVKAEAWLVGALCKQKFLAVAPNSLIKLAYYFRSVLHRGRISNSAPTQNAV
jgi:glycosyltransferase involved in cell wall biosynthesis